MFAMFSQVVRVRVVFEKVQRCYYEFAMLFACRNAFGVHEIEEFVHVVYLVKVECVERNKNKRHRCQHSNESNRSAPNKHQHLFQAVAVLKAIEDPISNWHKGVNQKCRTIENANAKNHGNRVDQIVVFVNVEKVKAFQFGQVFFCVGLIVLLLLLFVASQKAFVG